jgi:hypothetical protein
MESPQTVGSGKVTRRLSVSSFGNPQSNGVCQCRRSEREDTWQKYVDFG